MKPKHSKIKCQNLATGPHRGTLAKNIGRGRAESNMGIGKFNLRRTEVRKIGKIHLNHFLIYNYLKQHNLEQLPLLKYDSDATMLHPIEYRVFFSVFTPPK